MDEVVVLRWDRSASVLTFVPVNGGSGGAEVALEVDADSAREIDGLCAAASLPRVGRIEVEGVVCLLEFSGPPAVLCTARWRKPHIRLTGKANRTVIAELPPDRLGLATPEHAQLAENIGSFLYFTYPGGQSGVAGCWVCEGGLAGWVDRRAATLSQRAARSAEKAAQAAAAARADDTFVNPYTFVPFPQSITTARPPGHQALARDRLSGVMRVRWEFTTWLQAPDGSVSGQPLRLPGSSVKGAVRSLHETLAGGCLRVLDETFLPSYRNAASVLSPQWTLAVVDSATRDGQPLSVTLCDTVVWVRGEQLHQAWDDRRLQTGRRVSFPLRTRTVLDRLELLDDQPVQAGGDWTVLLTDAGARSREKGVYFAACGRVGASVAPVSEDAWRQFRRAVSGARDVRQRRAKARAGDTAGGPAAQWPPVSLGDKRIGRRKEVTGRFDTGDVLWVRCAQSGETAAGSPDGHSDTATVVDALSLSAIWRHPGTGELATRVPPYLLPCTDPTRLCASCRIFGAADTTPRDPDGNARQRAYAGHVRFGDAVSPAPVALQSVNRAPLGAPQPGAGQFYLRYSDTSSAADGEVPTREWGAAPDTREPRQVRGRKFYWHADPQRQQVPRHEARPHQSRLAVARQLAPAGTVLEQAITFDNLDEADLGGLLATLQPGRVLPPDTPGNRVLGLRLGGGKPLGLGSCRAVVEDLRVWTAHSRYGGAPTVAADPDRYVARFVAATVPAVAATWPALSAVLAADSVNARQVWYPPGAHWSDQDPDDVKALQRFDEPFAFFTGTSGMYLAEAGPRPLRPLPEPTEPDQSLPIIRKQDLEQGQRKQPR
jgi:hypothetical protein